MESPVPSSDPQPRPRADDGPRIKRINRACVNCRKRKSRCLLSETPAGVPHIPCVRCKRESLECILGTSNRGGRRIRKSSVDGLSPTLGGTPISQNGGLLFRAYSSAIPSSEVLRRLNGPSLHNATDGPIQIDHSPLPAISTDKPYNPHQNSADALGILAQVAETSNGDKASADSRKQSASAMPATPAPPAPSAIIRHPRTGYKLVDEGKITVGHANTLLRMYEVHYHGYFPIALRGLGHAPTLEHLFHEPHVLTAIFTIVSKDEGEPEVYRSCANYMRELIANLSCGVGLSVGAVEAMLLLAEWTPLTQLTPFDYCARGEEDNEAWMHIGLALRVAHLLNLDKDSRQSAIEEKGKLRRKLAWGACCMADCRISSRLDRPSASRWPPANNSDRPLLQIQSWQPQNKGDDYEKILLASQELTKIYKNAYDVLYSAHGPNFGTFLARDYVKYADEFRSAVHAWTSVWGTLTCSPTFKAALLMSYDYVRVYLSSFAFASTIHRTQTQKRTHPNHTNDSMSNHSYSPIIPSIADARFIYEGIDAAKSIMTTLNNFVDPEATLRHMPMRFTQYPVHAGVFLYHVRCSGLLSPDEERAIRALVQEVVSRLGKSSVSPQQPAARYAVLLKMLWQKAERSPQHIPAYFGAAHPDQNHGASRRDRLTFSWTDLKAISDFVLDTREGDGGGGNWKDFLPKGTNDPFSD